MAISAGGALSPRTETGLAVPPNFKASPISAFDSVDLSCSPFGLLSLVALDSEGPSLTHALRTAILRAILFLATSHHCAPITSLWAAHGARSRGLHFLR
ncbi:MAG: hypothetical protein ACI8RZ_007573 [Myxococcota bacterium]